MTGEIIDFFNSFIAVSSGLAAITAPPFPVTFWGTIFQPLRFSSSATMNRACVSAPPPAVKAIIRLIGPEGFQSAVAGEVMAAARPAAIAALAKCFKFMCFLFRRHARSGNHIVLAARRQL